MEPQTVELIAGAAFDARGIRKIMEPTAQASERRQYQDSVSGQKDSS
jgi:hypothetical protein